jgi:hypothetical protein
MDLSNPIISAGFAMTFFSCLFVLAVVFKKFEGPSKQIPNSTLDDSIVSLETTSRSVKEVPWTTQKRNGFTRVLGTRKELAFVTELPKQFDSARNGLSQNAWFLSTTTHFKTGYPTTYPNVTILHVPQDTPKHVKFLLDADNGYGTGLKPMILQNNSPLNMSINEIVIGARNVTGDYAHSFVLINEASHTVFFATRAYDEEDLTSEALSKNVRPTYWIIEPKDWILFWPANRYWASKSASEPRFWNASILPKKLQSLDHAASAAETMTNVLYNRNPTAS